jgi:hypothetical protein
VRRRIALTAIAALALASVPAVAVAGKGGNGNGNGGGGNGNLSASASLSLNESNPSLGNWVTFSSDYPSNTKNPRIQVMCYQDGNLVYGEAGAPDHSFELGGASSDWRRNGGSASCKADLMDLYSTGQGQQVEWLSSYEFDAAG